MTSWDDYKLFLKVANAKSLREATKEAGTSQATLSRVINRLESQLGVVLISRSHKGMQLTEHGVELRRLLEPAAEVIASAESQLMGRVDEIAGKVTITYPYALSHLVLPVIEEVCEEHPGLIVDLLDADNFANLDENDADIAVRIANTASENLIGRKVTRLPVAIYGKSELYPLDVDLTQVPFAGLAGPWSQFPIGREIKKYTDQTHINVSSSTTLESVIASGAAVGFILCILGDRLPGVHRLSEPSQTHGIDVWVFVHRYLKNLKRVRVLADAIFGSLKDRLKE